MTPSATPVASPPDNPESATASTATLSFDGRSYDFSIFEGSEGEKAIDFSKLRALTGLVSHDPGFANTGACKSSITFINGEQGILKYRGIPIEEIAAQASFLDVAYLIINGNLPDATQLDAFVGEITRHTMLHEDIKSFYRGFPKDAHPMAI